MEKFKKVLHALLFPKIIITVLCAILAAALLFDTFVLAENQEGNPVAYITYFFSAYALIIVCIRFIPLIKNIKKFAHENPFIHRYMTDIPFKTKISLYCSLGINTAYVVLKFVSGVYYGSAWLITLAAYYTLLVAMRFLLLRHMKRNSNNRQRAWKRYRFCGIVLMPMNIILTGMVILVLQTNEGFTYDGYLIYVMAMYDFYTMTMSVINLVKYKRHGNPVLSAAKAINVVVALISILSLETAMITQFGDENDKVFRHVMIASTGGCICVLVLGMAIFMIVRSTKQLKQMQMSNSQS